MAINTKNLFGDPRLIMGLSLLNAGNPQGGYGGILNSALAYNALQRRGQNDDLKRKLYEMQINQYQRRADQEKKANEYYSGGMPMAPFNNETEAYINFLSNSPLPEDKRTAIEMRIDAAKGKEPIKMGDDTLLDPDTYQPIWQAPQEPKDRGMKQGADGYWYYTDTKERVFPNVAKPDDQPDVFGNENTLRDEFVTQSKDFVKVRDSYGRILKSAENPSPAGDLSMIFNYMKMLDPNSVVRESEFATAATAKPLVERMGLSWDAIDAVWQGRKLTTQQRADFVNRADQLYQSQLGSQKNLADVYSGLATRYNLSPENIVIDYDKSIRDMMEEMQKAEKEQEQGLQMPSMPQSSAADKVVNWGDLP